MKKITKKIPVVIFLLCFLPYAFILVMSLYYAFAGYEIRGFVMSEPVEVLYGTKAFAECAITLISIFWYFFIIPICLIYQAIYIFVRFYLWDKKKNGD